MSIFGIKAKRTVHVLNTGYAAYKLFQTMFLRDGSLVVSFPYLRNQTCFMCEADAPAGAVELATFRVGSENAYGSSHAVKYTHHIDGRAHFSQDGKIYTRVKRQSVRLDAINGHVFTLKLQNFDQFQIRAPKDRNNPPDKAIVEYRAPQTASAIQFTGWVRDRREFERGIIRKVTPVTGPAFNGVIRPGCVATGVIFAWPHGFEDQIFIVAVEEIASVGTPWLCFLGGFDGYEVVEDLSGPAGFLFLASPHPVGDMALDRLLDFRPTGPLIK